MSNYIKVLPAVSTPIGATLMKTGQTTSYRTGDDGDLERGRATDFFTLPSNNPFGNNRRFTGTTGGYQTGGVNYNKDGGTTTAALAFPNDIVLNWGSFDGNKVIGMRRTISFDSYANTETAYAALTIGGYTGWYIPNINEVLDFALKTGGRSFDYNPLNISSSVFFYSSTLASTTVAYIISNVSFEVTGGLISGARGCFPIREFTVTGTTLT
jgi:hypothetical protein